MPHLNVKLRQKRTSEAYSKGARAMAQHRERMAKTFYKPPEPEPEPEPTWEPPPNPWSLEHYNLTEQGRILREDPALAQRYIEEVRRGRSV